MTIHDVPPLNGPPLFIGGPLNMQFHPIAKGSGTVVVSPERKLSPGPVDESAVLPSVPVHTYTRKWMLTIFGTAIPVFILATLTQSEVDACVRASRFCVALDVHAR